MFNEYPYTDLHNLNLDWFLDQFKKMGKHLADLKKMVLSAPDATNANPGQAPIADGAGGWAWGDVESGGITVDSELSATSTNPVQNKVIKSALDEKASGTVSRSDSTRAITNSQFKVIDRVTTNSAGQVTEVRTTTVGIPTASTNTAGLMSATDKANLDTLMSDYQSASTALG